MDRLAKLRLMVYYKSTKCACGNTKLTLRWGCLDCRNKNLDSPEWQELSENCEKHFASAAKFIDLIKK